MCLGITSRSNVSTVPPCSRGAMPSIGEAPLSLRSNVARDNLRIECLGKCLKSLPTQGVFPNPLSLVEIHRNKNCLNPLWVSSEGCSTLYPSSSHDVGRNEIDKYFLFGKIFPLPRPPRSEAEGQEGNPPNFVLLTELVESSLARP